MRYSRCVLQFFLSLSFRLNTARAASTRQRHNRCRKKGYATDGDAWRCYLDLEASCTHVTNWVRVHVAIQTIKAVILLACIHTWHLMTGQNHCKPDDGANQRHDCEQLPSHFDGVDFRSIARHLRDRYHLQICRATGSSRRTSELEQAWAKFTDLSHAQERSEAKPRKSRHKKRPKSRVVGRDNGSSTIDATSAPSSFLARSEARTRLESNFVLMSRVAWVIAKDVGFE